MQKRNVFLKNIMTSHDHTTVDSFFDDQLYWWNKIFLLMSGRWPYQNHKWRKIILFTLLSGNVMVTSGEVRLLIIVNSRVIPQLVNIA